MHWVSACQACHQPFNISRSFVIQLPSYQSMSIYYAIAFLCNKSTTGYTYYNVSDDLKTDDIPLETRESVSVSVLLSSRESMMAKFTQRLLSTSGVNLSLYSSDQYLLSVIV